MIYLESKSFDPHFNLAMEQYIFDQMDRNEEYFFLWQNANTIVVGKHQNTIGEINQKFVEEHNISVVRRLSGGGAVYHDMGNLNFTIIVSRTDQMADFDFSRFCLPVVNALKKLGVKAEINGRNDITIDGKKFSGNSQYMKQGRIMHHGAILYASDLTTVSKALIVSKDKIASKGVTSVRSRVTNVVDYMEKKVPLEVFKKALLDEMGKREKLEKQELTTEDIEKIKEIQKARYDTWEWNYGKSPKYDIEKERYIEGCGKFQLNINVKDGIIIAFDVFGDYFGNGDKEDVQKLLQGVKINREALTKVLADFPLDNYFHNLPKETFVDMIVE